MRPTAHPMTDPAPSTARGIAWTLRSSLRAGWGWVDPVNRSVTEALHALRMQLDAGVGLGRSLRTSAPICKPAVARSCFLRAGDAVDGGASFDEALAMLSPVIAFPERAMLSAGWAAGRIDPVMRAVVRRREVMFATRREFRSRMTWPMLNLVVACGVIALLGWFRGGSAAGTLLGAFGPLALAVGAFVAFRLFQVAAARRHAGREMSAPPPPTTVIDPLLLRVPVVSRVQRWRNRGEFASTMSTLLGAGLGMLAALDVVARALPNGVYRGQARAARDRIAGEGVALHEALPRDGSWPPEWLASMEAAYISGTEERVLGRLGEDGRERYLNAVKVAGFWASWLIYLGVMGFVASIIVRLWLEAFAQVGL